MFDCKLHGKEHPVHFPEVLLLYSTEETIIWFNMTGGRVNENRIMLCMRGEVKKLYSTPFSEEPVLAKRTHTHMQTLRKQTDIPLRRDSHVWVRCKGPSSLFGVIQYDHSILEMQHMMCLYCSQWVMQMTFR